jgi:hypothetical protein
MRSKRRSSLGVLTLHVSNQAYAHWCVYAAGILRQIESVLSSPRTLAQFMSHNGGSGNILPTWTFACRYRLEKVLKGVERFAGVHGIDLTSDLADAIDRASSLPSSSTDLALCSLMRVLHTTHANWGKLATALHEVCKVAWNKVPGNPHISRRQLESILETLDKLIDDLGPSGCRSSDLPPRRPVVQPATRVVQPATQAVQPATWVVQQAVQPATWVVQQPVMVGWAIAPTLYQ